MESQFTIALVGILILLIAGVGVWGGYRYRRLNLKVKKLKQSLLELRENLHEQDAEHTQKKAEWEQARAKLRSYLQLMDTLVNTIPNPIYFKDEKGRYQGCNKVFAGQILGITRDLIIGKQDQDLKGQIASNLAAVCRREEQKMIKKNSFHSFESKVRCADGKLREFLFTMAPVVDSKDRLSGTVVVLSDLTDKNRITRHHMNKEKLEGVLETAGAVCHEFNQPLQAITGYTELMAMKLDGHKAHRYIDKITLQIKRMQDITDKLQGVTRYETMGYAGNTKIIDIHKASETE